MLRNRCWPTIFSYCYSRSADRWCQKWLVSICMFDEFHLTFNFTPKCHMTFSKTKMNVNWHLDILLSKCHLNVTCLVVRVISIFKVPIDVWVFLFTSHTAKSKSKLCVSIDVHHFLCKFLRVKCKKLTNTLSNIHTGRHDQPLQCQSYISIGSFSLHLERCRFIRQSDIEFWRTKLEPALRNCAGTCFFRARPEATSSQPCWSRGKKFSTTRAHRICRMQYHDNPRNLTNFKRTKSVCDLLKEAGSLKPELDLYKGRCVLNGHLSN